MIRTLKEYHGFTFYEVASLIKGLGSEAARLIANKLGNEPIKYGSLTLGQTEATLNRLISAAPKDIGNDPPSRNLDVINMILAGDLEIVVQRQDKIAKAEMNFEFARKIMGSNIFGLSEVVKYFGINPNCEQMQSLAEIPFSEAELQRYKDTHVLVAVLPVSIVNIANRYRELFGSQVNISEECCYNQGTTGWCLVRKAPIENSFFKFWQEQQLLMPEGEKTPSSRILIYTIIGHFLATGERLFVDTYAHTSDIGWNARFIYVGNSSKAGIQLGTCITGNGKGAHVGLASFIGKLVR